MITRIGARAMLRMTGKGIERIEVRTFVIKPSDFEASMLSVEFLRG